MELALGTETLNEYCAFELAAAARKIVEQVMLIKPGENVVVSADTKSDWRVVMATTQAAYAAGAIPTVICYESRPHGAMEPPSPVAAAVARADAWIECSVAYTLFSEAQRAAIKAGVRYGGLLVGMDVDSVVSTIGKVDYPLMLSLGERLRSLTHAAREIRITGPGGMDVSFRTFDSKVVQSGGLGDKPGTEVMLGGQVGWQADEESERTINGKLVFDGTVYPPAEIGALRNPVTVRIEQGRIVEILGGTEASMVEAYFAGLDDPNMYRVAGYVYGFNPGVTKITGRLNQDERFFGCVCFEFGASATRVAAGDFNGVTMRPSVWLDEVEIEREGTYVHPDLVAICRQMRIPGY